MNKQLSITSIFLSLLLLTSCVKAAKDLVEDIDQRTKCVEQLSEFTTDESDKTCAQITAEIDKILKDCGEFMTQDQIDELNFAKDNCTDN